MNSAALCIASGTHDKTGRAPSGLDNLNPLALRPTLFEVSLFGQLHFMPAASISGCPRVLASPVCLDLPCRSGFTVTALHRASVPATRCLPQLPSENASSYRPAKPVSQG